jgi:(E)-4-hydroxy-3-methylbut-2-enyl-diphosphate synthase
MIDLFNYHRRETSTVHIGKMEMGGKAPIRIQSMTTTSTDDTEGSVAQAERIIKAGGELVRLTTQGVREAENLKNIKERLRKDGFAVPIVADVHFNAKVADVAALYADKVRINPGNYVDPARQFIRKEYTDEEYAAELQKIEDRFVPFLRICKEHGTAIRIGVNHGSLSDRIRNRYGDTPEGIVESCMEFLRICKKEKFDDVVLSIKASNTVVMVRSVRLLVDAMDREDMHYPLHLGVTEAGEGEDGRIKSCVGIGALLADGIGDTIRVSLSEEPEAEIPVARHLVDYVTRRAGHLFIPGEASEDFDWLHPSRRVTMPVRNVGGDNVPIVICNEEPEASGISGLAEISGKSGTAEKSGSSGTAGPSDKPHADYLYCGNHWPDNPNDGREYIVDFNIYADRLRKQLPVDHCYPIFPVTAMPLVSTFEAPMKFLVLQFGTPAEEYLTLLRLHPEVVVICTSNHQNRLGCQRAVVHEMMNAGVQNPVVFAQMYQLADKEEFQLEASAYMGALMMDGLTDGIWLMNHTTDNKSKNHASPTAKDIEETAFAILQAARLRTTKTEYISCPGCGRTLYNLRETIARIKKATESLKGLKIGIMGCIVNGPGEMADADYGYVGAGPHRVSLYRKQVCVEKNIPEDEAVEHLLKLIESDQKKN